MPSTKCKKSRSVTCKFKWATIWATCWGGNKKCPSKVDVKYRLTFNGGSWGLQEGLLGAPGAPGGAPGGGCSGISLASGGSWVLMCAYVRSWMFFWKLWDFYYYRVYDGVWEEELSVDVCCNLKCGNCVIICILDRKVCSKCP